MTQNSDFSPFAEKMQTEGLPQVAIETFHYYYNKLVEGQTGLISEDDIEAVTSLPNADALSQDLQTVGEEALPKTVLIKLNGGLGTGMGLQKAKSLLPVKQGLAFLDIIARQAIYANVPLVLMNSFVTREDSLDALKSYDDLWGDIPLDFVQHKIPKVLQSDLSPAQHNSDPKLEWCPPGHGDIYTALVTSGMLDMLLEAGYEYAFVSNSDNLGAVLDEAILGYFAQNNFPFMMEVADRTEADKKGGHLARREDGRLVLRESAQCPPEDEDQFQNVDKHKYFNTNNLWLNLPALKAKLEEKDNILGLPMIVNSKHVNPRDPNSPKVYQLETAMGAAIAVFEEAQALRVPRTRFAPVKKTNDLLTIRSDAYTLSDDFRVVPNPSRTYEDLLVDLDPAHYKFVTQLDDRFPHGAPSLLECERFEVQGDVRFGENVAAKDAVRIINLNDEQKRIESDSVLTGEITL